MKAIETNKLIKNYARARGIENVSLTAEDSTKLITVRLKENILTKLDKIASESNHSRNELIIIILSYGIENIEIQK